MGTLPDTYKLFHSVVPLEYTSDRLSRIQSQAVATGSRTWEMVLNQVPVAGRTETITLEYHRRLPSEFDQYGERRGVRTVPASGIRRPRGCTLRGCGRAGAEPAPRVHPRRPRARGFTSQLEPAIERGERDVEERGDAVRKFEGLGMVESDDVFREVAENESIVSAAQDLLGPDLKLLRSAAMFKPPRVGSEKDFTRTPPTTRSSRWTTSQSGSPSTRRRPKTAV